MGDASRGSDLTFNLLAAAGLGALSVGLWIQFGLGYALIADGALLLAGAVVVARGHTGGGSGGTSQ